MSRPFLLLALVALIPLPALASAPPDSGDVVITEIMYAPSPADNEYVELYNHSRQDVALDELEFADANRSFTLITTRDTVLAPGAWVVLVRDSSAFASAFPVTKALVPSDWPALNNGGDSVVLRHAPSGSEVDAVPYDPSWGGDDGAALERIDPDGPSDRASNFATSTAPNGGTPADRNSVYDPDETPPSLVHARPRPSGDSVIARFSEPLAPGSVTPTAFTLDGPAAPAVQTVTVSDTAEAQLICTLDRALKTGSYRLRAAQVSDRQGNVQSQTSASFQYFVPSVPSRRDVVITEIQYAPPSGGSEYVELLNRSSDTVDVGQLAIADANRDFTKIAPRLTALPPDSHAVVVDDAAAFHTRFPGVAVHEIETWDALNNGGDTVHLRYAPSSAKLDAVPYEPSWGGDGGASLERVDPAGPSDHPDNFGTSAAPTGGTPGRRNSLYNPDETSPTPLFAEQWTDTRLRLTFSEALSPSSVTARSFHINGTTITNARLRRDSLVALTLSSPPTASTIAVDGVKDRVGNATSTTVPVAFRPESGDLAITEIMYDPRTDDFDDRPNQVEYFELKNRSDHRLSLHGLVRTGRPNERGVADTLAVGGQRGLPAGGWAIVAAAPTDARHPERTRFATAFPKAPLEADSVAFLPIDASRLGLRNDGDRIRLHRRDGTRLATVEYAPDWHANGLEDPTGTALERISVTGDASAPDNWTSSTAPHGGTPGRPNASALAPQPERPSAGLSIEPSPFSVERDGATRIQYALNTVPNLVRVRIFDARGRKVRTLEKARLAGPTGELLWNGRNDAGQRVRIGIFVVLFEAVQSSNGTVARFKEPVVVARPLQ